MPYSYPPAAPTISGDLVTISRFLNDPTLIARRLRTLLEQRYIADALLTGRFSVEGGAVVYETGETIYSGENPKAVSPGGEYPLVNPSNGTASVAKTVKWGQDALVTDESIKRRKMDPVTKALLKLVNQNVKYVDSVALAAIASAVTNSANAAADWSTATGAQILQDALLAKANINALNEGFDADTVVVDDINHAYAMSAFVAAGFMPREGSNNPALTGEFPVIGGLRWLPSPNVPVANKALVLDSKQLGGMADEDLGGPGYAKASDGAGVEVKSIREDKNDQWRVRARRVTVPVVLEPTAARFINSI